MKNPLEQSKQNIFLTGVAGTGKTYLINDYLSRHADTTLIAAPTGTAAVNIGGVTCHRLFSIPVPAFGANPDKVTPSKLSVFKDADTIIIDEISMMRNDAFSFAMKVKKKAEKLFGHKIRLIVSGDFSQLPPIVKKSEEGYFSRYGFDKSGFAFTSKEWAECKFKTIELTEIKRQVDAEFIQHLAEARQGNKKCISYFNQFVSEDVPDDAIYVCGTNSEADKINKEYLDAIDEPVMAFQCEKFGITGKELPCDEILLLKKGCRVMFTANDSIIDADGKFNAAFGETGRYTNGEFAEVLDIGKDFVKVRTETGADLVIEMHKWSIYNYHTDRATATLKKTEIGYVKQMPLKVAKAITIHKSQGKTFDRVVLSPQIFAPGQLYVALSRVRGPEGLVLTEPILPEYLKIDSKVKKFILDGFTYEISDAQVKKQTEVEKKQATKRKSVRRKSSVKKIGGKKKVAAKTKSVSVAKKKIVKSTGSKRKVAKKSVRKTVKSGHKAR